MFSAFIAAKIRVPTQAMCELLSESRGATPLTDNLQLQGFLLLNDHWVCARLLSSFIIFGSLLCRGRLVPTVPLMIYDCPPLPPDPLLWSPSLSCFVSPMVVLSPCLSPLLVFPRLLPWFGGQVFFLWWWKPSRNLVRMAPPGCETLELKFSLDSLCPSGLNGLRLEFFFGPRSAQGSALGPTF